MNLKLNSSQISEPDTAPSFSRDVTAELGSIGALSPSNISPGARTLAKFFPQGTASKSELMMTGMSCKGDFVQSTMNQAKNDLKIKRHNEMMVTARIIKLAKEEEKSRNRIKEA